ncbi:MAG: hypothetical protein R6X13_07435 [bacterium]
MVVVLLLAAFEYAGWAAPAAEGLAGVSLQSWRLARSSPAQAAVAPRFAGVAGYARPYGLTGIDCGRIALGGRVGAVGLAGGVQALHLAGYSESDFHVAVGTATRGFAVGTGLHVLLLVDPQTGAALAPAFDVGARWTGQRFAAGIDALRLNSPLLGGDEVPARLALSGCWQPVPQFAATAEVGRERGDEDFAAACEFRPLAAVGVRAGVGVAPLRYAAGVGLAASRYGVDYCLELNPALGATHSLEVSARWQ